LREPLLPTLVTGNLLSKPFQADHETVLASGARKGYSRLETVLAANTGQPPPDKFHSQRVAVPALRAVDLHGLDHGKSNEKREPNKFSKRLIVLVYLP
jgi:hypothetical protein